MAAAKAKMEWRWSKDAPVTSVNLQRDGDTLTITDNDTGNEIYLYPAQIAELLKTLPKYIEYT